MGKDPIYLAIQEYVKPFSLLPLRRLVCPDFIFVKLYFVFVKLYFVFVKLYFVFVKLYFVFHFQR